MTDIRLLDVRRELQQRVNRSMARLDGEASRPICVAFVGESNSGKTTAANSLLGDGLLPTAVITNTRFPTLVRYAAEPTATAITRSGARRRLTANSDLPDEPPALIEVGLPNERLANIEILDTPGDFSVDELSALPGLSPVRVPVWCTVATQAWKESERRAWQDLPGRITRNGILAVTRLDRVSDPVTGGRLLSRLELEAAPHFARRVVSWSADAPAHPPVSIAGWGLLTEVVPEFAAALRARRHRTVGRLKLRLGRFAGLPGGRADDASSGPTPLDRSPA